MSAQYEGMIKRVQHAFAARNGLFGTLIAKTGYVGIKRVFERPYGGFLTMFSAGNQRDPPFRVREIVAGLGETWHTQVIRVKLYAAVGGCHGQIECLAKMQSEYPERFVKDALPLIVKIVVGLSDPIFAHDGWQPDQRPLTSTGAQMCAAYIGAVQLIDHQVLLRQFEDDNLDRDEVWDLVWKTECQHDADFDKPNFVCGARVRVEFADGFAVEKVIEMPKGFDPPVTNEEIREKWRQLAGTVVDGQTMRAIERSVLDLEKLENVSELTKLLGQSMKKKQHLVNGSE